MTDASVEEQTQKVSFQSQGELMIFQLEPDLMFGKWNKNSNNGHSKQALVAKNAENCPQNWINSSFAWLPDRTTVGGN